MKIYNAFIKNESALGGHDQKPNLSSTSSLRKNTCSLLLISLSLKIQLHSSPASCSMKFFFVTCGWKPNINFMNPCISLGCSSYERSIALIARWRLEALSSAPSYSRIVIVEISTTVLKTSWNWDSSVETFV